MAYSEAVNSIKVAITLDNYPLEELKEEQFEKIERSILERVDNTLLNVEKRSNIGFLGCTHKPGLLILNCVDKASRDWLVNQIDHLVPWEGAKLKWFEGDQIPKPSVHRVWVADPKAEPKAVLHRIRCQNDGLNTQSWKILHVHKEDKGQTLTLSIDRRSEEKLRENAYMAFLTFNKIKFRPTKNQHQPPQKRESGEIKCKDTNEVPNAKRQRLVNRPCQLTDGCPGPSGISDVEKRKVSDPKFSDVRIKTLQNKGVQETTDVLTTTRNS